jgi:hypothetical protein
MIPSRSRSTADLTGLRVTMLTTVSMPNVLVAAACTRLDASPAYVWRRFSRTAGSRLSPGRTIETMIRPRVAASAVREEVGDCLAAYAPRLPQVTQSSHPEGDRREDQRDHDHEQHPQEDLSHRTSQILVDPHDRPVLPSQRLVRRNPDHGPDEEPEQDLGVQLHPFAGITDRLSHGETGVRRRSAGKLALGQSRARAP